MVKTSDSRAGGELFDSRFIHWDISGSSHTSEFKTVSPVGYWVSAETGWPGVSMLWLDEIESLICNFYHSVEACATVWADPSLRSCWGVKQPRNKTKQTFFRNMHLWNSNCSALGLKCRDMKALLFFVSLVFLVCAALKKPQQNGLTVMFYLKPEQWQNGNSFFWQGERGCAQLQKHRWLLQNCIPDR